MKTNPYLPPGCSHRDFDRERNYPAKMHCIGCWLLFPQEQLDEDQTCETCRREKVSEDDPREER